MQRGTALKWIDALEIADGSVKYDNAQLRYVISGVVFMCPFGVILDTIDNSKWCPAWDGVSFLWDGSQFSVPTEFQKRAKMKTDGFDAMAAFETMHTFAEAAEYVKTRYQEI